MTLRITTIIASALLLLSSCGQRTAKTTEEEASTENTQLIESLDKESFAKKVADYRNNSEWNYVGDKPAVIDFFAEWCGPCKMIAPIMDKLAEEYEGQVVFYQIDVDQEQELTQFFGIQGMPTVFFIPMEGEPESVLGARSEDEYRKLIENYLL